MSNKSKLTLIIDGNWLLMSRLSVLANKYVDDIEMIKYLKLLMAKSILLTVKTFKYIDNIIFVADGGSWRNYVDVPKFLSKSNIEYKGNRIKSNDINWDLVFAGYEDFINILKDHNINVCKEQYVEGDDWCYHWSKLLNSQNTNVIIWSKDKDLTQLVHTDNNCCFTVCWGKDYGTVAEDVHEEDLDFFFNPYYAENNIIYNDIISHSIKTEKINPKHIVLDKILRGDAGDNIIPCALRKSKTGSDRMFKISNKDINYDLDFTNDDEILKYFDMLLNSKSYKDRIINTNNDILEHFKYNRQLVYLNEESYPKNIKEIFSNYMTYDCCKSIEYVVECLQADGYNINNILNSI